MAAVSIITSTAGALLIAASPTVSSFSLVTASLGGLEMVATATLRINSLLTGSNGELAIVATPTLRINSMVGQSNGELSLDAAPLIAIGLVSPSDGGLELAIVEEISEAMDWVMRSSTVKSRLRLNRPSGLTVFDAARECYNLWKIEITDPTQITFARERVLGYINNAVQTMHSRAHKLDYFTREPIEVTVPGGASSIELPDSVQVVRGPVKLSSSKMPLRMVGSQTEIDQFVACTYGENPPPSEPRAYYVDSSHQADADNVALVLHVSPAPVDNTALTLHASLEPPRYDVGHLFAVTPLQVPARWAETIFWPLLRYAAAGDTMFKSEELRADINGKYTAAAEVLGLLNPPPPEGSKPK